MAGISRSVKVQVYINVAKVCKVPREYTPDYCFIIRFKPIGEHSDRHSICCETIERVNPLFSPRLISPTVFAGVVLGERYLVVKVGQNGPTGS
ncbi:MAG TPA: hypothetical protein VG204_06695 [Terriglobia bacterium]|nr:hypothetical protein [Terriglobia bacterium]